MNITKTFFSLGTVNTVTLFEMDTNSAEKIIDLIIKRVMEIDDRMSAFKNESDVSIVSANAGIKPIRVSWDTFYVISRSLELSKITKGVFDITAGPLIKLWNIGNFICVPNDKEIKKVKKLVNYKDVKLNIEKLEVYLKKKGQSIDLGGVAKGYAADEAYRILNDNSIKNGVINFGGNIVIFGKKQDEKDWEIGIQYPNHERFETAANIIIPNEITKKTFVTSGLYEKFVKIDNKIYHHIMDPRTGYPVENNVLSVTVIGENSMESDIISTALFILGHKEGESILKKMGYDAVFILDSSEVLASKGIKLVL